MSFADVSEITQRVYEYAYGIDTRDWDLYRSIFTDQIYTDFSSYNGNPAAELTADDWVAGVKPLFTGLDATQHVMTNPLVDINEDEARCRMYMQAEHFLITDQGNNDYALGGYYDNRLIQRNNRWHIRSVTLNVFWHRGNRHIMDLAVIRGQAKLAAS